MRFVPAFLLLSLLALTGCNSKVRFEKDLTVEATAAANQIIEAPKKQQTVLVELAGVTEPVDVFVILAKDFQSVEETIMAGLKAVPSQVLAHKKKTKDTTLEALIPAGEEYHVYIQAVEKKAQLKLKINSK